MPSWVWQLALVYCAAVWGATFYMVKEAIAGVHPAALVGYRFALSAALLAPWLLLRRGGPSGRTPKVVKDGAALAGLLFALYVSQTVGLAHTSASNSGFITGLFVVFVPAIVYLAHRRAPTFSQKAAVGLAVAGLWLLTGGLSSINKGDALTLIAAVTYAGHVLLTDRCVREEGDPGWLAFHQFWMTGAASLAACLLMGLPLSVGSPKTAWVIVFLAVVPTLSAFFIQLFAQKHVEPMRVSLLFSLEPVFAAVFAWTLGGEPFHAAGAAGGGLIVAAMAVSELSPRTETAPAPARGALPEAA